MNEIKGFDVLKFILAYFVIANHCGLHDYNSWAFTIIEVAVPCFFIMSGYLLQCKLEQSGGRYFDRYLRHILKLYLTWSLVYLPFTVYGLCTREENFLLRMFFVFRGWFLVGENYMSWSLWYLLALIVAVWIIKILYMRKWSEGQIVIVSALLSIIGILLEDVSTFDDELPIAKMLIIKGYFFILGTVRNGLFIGLGFVSVGMLLAKYYHSIQKTPAFVFVVLSVASYFLYYYQVPLAVHVLATCIVITFMKLHFSLGTFDKHLRVMSTNIYFMHMILVGTINIFVPEMKFVEKFIISSLFTSLLSVLIQVYKYRLKYTAVPFRNHRCQKARI